MSGLAINILNMSVNQNLPSDVSTFYFPQEMLNISHTSVERQTLPLLSWMGRKTTSFWPVMASMIP